MKFVFKSNNYLNLKFIFAKHTDSYKANELVYVWDTEGSVSLTDDLVMSQFDLISYPCRNGTKQFRRGWADMKTFFILIISLISQMTVKFNHYKKTIKFRLLFDGTSELQFHSSYGILFNSNLLSLCTNCRVIMGFFLDKSRGHIRSRRFRYD